MADLEGEMERERREKEWAETWKPSGPGDALIGILEDYDEATTDFGTYRVAHIRNEDGVLKGLWLMHSVLQDEWNEAAPQKGDRVGAMYHGQRSGDTYDYHMWSVKVDRESAAPEDAGEQAGTDSPDAAADRKPEGRGPEAPEDAPGFEGDELFGPPAIDTESGEAAPQGAGSDPAGESNGESTLDDPNGGLPF